MHVDSCLRPSSTCGYSYNTFFSFWFWWLGLWCFSLWHKVYIRSLLKITNLSLAIHFRPESILPFLSCVQVLDACVHKKMSHFINHNNLLCAFQSGFKPGHNTTSALLKVTGDIRACIKVTKMTVLVLVDFTNAVIPSVTIPSYVSFPILWSLLVHWNCYFLIFVSISSRLA